AADFRHLSDVAAGFLDSGDVRNFGQPRQRGWFDGRARASGDVIKDDGLVHGLRDGAEVPVLSFLRGLVVVRGRSEYAAARGERGNLFSFVDCVLSRIRGPPSHNRTAP